MKKILSVTLAAAMMVTLFAGCGAKKPAETVAPETILAPEALPETELAPEETLGANAAADVMTDPSMPEPNEAGKFILKMYENHKATGMPLVINNLDVNDVDVLGSYTGLTSGDKLSEGAASELMMGQPYSLVVLKVKDAADAQAVAQEMYDNVDLRKWICMEADTKTAGYVDDIAFFFMVNSDFAESATTDSMLEAFKAAAGKDVSVIG